MAEESVWLKNQRCEDVQDLEDHDQEADHDPDLDPEVVLDPNPGAVQDPILPRIVLALRAEVLEGPDRGLEIAMMMRARMAIVILVRDPVNVLGKDPANVKDPDHQDQDPGLAPDLDQVPIKMTEIKPFSPRTTKKEIKIKNSISRVFFVAIYYNKKKIIPF